MGKGYGRITLLLLVLAWLMLLNQAVVVNMREMRRGLQAEDQALAQERRSAAEEEAKMETAASVQGQEPSPLQTAAEEQAETVESVSEPRIRVLLMDTGFHSYHHASVRVLLDGKEVLYTPESQELQEGSVILEEREEGITVLSIERAEGPPVYRGTLEISLRAEGILLVNEVSLETYLEGVVPSEMPSSYEKEALMAQAVCARTYAWRQMEDGALRERFGADVDDSVNYQVYQNITPREETSEAVRATAGQVLCQDGELIQAYYFSTSAGVTSTDEVWGAGEAAPYLKSVTCEFDSHEPWSRWETELSWEILTERASALEGCSGALLAVEAVKKSQSGAVTELSVVTEGGTAQISGEYAVRQFLSPYGCMITESDGSQTEGGSLLPSAYVSLEMRAGEKLVLQGRGYGHGVGMSQTAANEMAKEGYSFRDILDYFFKDVEIVRRG